MTKTDKLLWLGMCVKNLDTIGHGSIGFLLWVEEKSDNEGVFKSSFRDITAVTGKSVGTIHRTIKSLVTHGLLEVLSGAGSQARTYKLTLKR